MAHRLIWKHESSVNVVIFERGVRVPGVWSEEDRTGNIITVKGKNELRNYSVREWLSPLECRATLVSVMYNKGAFNVC